MGLSSLPPAHIEARKPLCTCPAPCTLGCNRTNLFGTPGRDAPVSTGVSADSPESTSISPPKSPQEDREPTQGGRMFSAAGPGSVLPVHLQGEESHTRPVQELCPPESRHLHSSLLFRQEPP